MLALGSTSTVTLRFTFAIRRSPGETRMVFTKNVIVEDVVATTFPSSDSEKLSADGKANSGRCARVRYRYGLTAPLPRG